MNAILSNRRSAFTAAAPYVAEAMASTGGTLLSVGIFFYMKDRFGWQMPQNFLLAAAQGVAYVPGALLAGRVTDRFDRRRAIIVLYLVLAALTLAAWAAAGPLDAPALVVAGILLVYTFVIGISWPILESLTVGGGDARDVARRVAIYNIIWPATGAAAMAVEGVILRYWPAGIFLLPMVAGIVAAAVLLGMRGNVPHGSIALVDASTPEPELLRVRTMALWLSRTALPATYVVIYGLMPMMASLPTVQRLPTTLQTVVASVWLVTRLLAFVILAAGTWWHTRPRVLLWGAVVMLISFFGMLLPPTHGRSPQVDLISLTAWQAVLGLALGVIYSGSLYFGMVLSDGSTEHGGYHEALIGVGWMLGPAAGAITQRIWPNQLWIGIAAVGAVIIASVLLVLVTATVMSAKNRLR